MNESKIHNFAYNNDRKKNTLKKRCLAI